jgi:predicted nucleic acid-binding Zn ribbon protein
VTPCPNCGAPTEPGQLVCVECGRRLALEQEDRGGRRFDNLPAIAVLLAVVVLGAAGFGYALAELTDDSGDDSSASADRTTTQPATAPETETDTGEAQQPSQSLLLTWPKGVTAYTVVLVTSSDKPAATRVAREAAQSGLEAGLLRSDDYDLGTGLWIVFAGRFDNQASAERQAGNLAARYPGAYATLVKPAA